MQDSSSKQQTKETEVTQSYLTLCDPMDCGLPGFSIHGILQARILEWVFPSPGDLPYPGIEPGSPTLEADALTSEPPGKQTTNKTKMQTQSSADRITTSLSLTH